MVPPFDFFWTAIGFVGGIFTTAVALSALWTQGSMPGGPRSKEE